MHFDFIWFKTTKNYGSGWSRNSCRSYYETLSRAGVARATEIHIHGKKRMFVRLSRVKLDSHRHCVRSPARIASTSTTCLFSLSLSLLSSLSSFSPSTVHCSLPPTLPPPSIPSMLASGIEELFFSLSLSLCLLLSFSLPLFLFFFLYASWSRGTRPNTNDSSLSLDGKRLSSNTFDPTQWRSWTQRMKREHYHGKKDRQ